MLKNQRKIGVILSYVSKAISILVGITYTPFLLRFLGQSEYGLYSIAVSVISYLSIIDLGFSNAYLRFYSEVKTHNNKEKEANLNGMFFIIFSFLGLLSVIAGIIIVLNLEIIYGPGLTNIELIRLKKMVFILVINMAITFLGVIFSVYINANQKFIAQYSISILQQLLKPFLTLPLLLMGYGTLSMVIVIVTVSILIEIVNVLYCYKYLDFKMSISSIDWSYLKRISSFSFFILLQMITDQLNWNVDNTLVARYHGTDAVAVYTVGSDFNTYFMNLTAAISTIYTPEVHLRIANNESTDSITQLYARVSRLQLIPVMLIFLGFVTFGRPFIEIWAGKEYVEAYGVAIILMISMVFAITQNLGIAIRRAKDLHKIPAILMLLVAILNVIISIPMTKRFGLIGAATGTGISLFINQILINFYYHKIVKLNMIYYWKNVLKSLKGYVIPVLITVIFSYLRINNTNISNIQYLFLIIPYVILFILSVYFLSLNDKEREIAFKRR